MKRTEQSTGRNIIPILSDTDIVEARMAARALAEYVGFNGADLVIIATAVSEVARNIIEYAKPGKWSYPSSTAASGAAWRWWRAIKALELLIFRRPCRTASLPPEAWDSGCPAHVD